MINEGIDGFMGTCVYKPHLFSDGKIDRLLQDFHEVLKHMVTWPEQPISAIPVSFNMSSR